MITKSRCVLTWLLLVCCTPYVAGQKKSDELLELQDQQARSICVYFLDSYLCLSAEQADSVEKLFVEKWDSELNPSAAYMVYNGINVAQDCFECLDDEELREILDEKQFETYQALPTLPVDLSGQLNWMGATDGDTENDSDPLTPLLKAISDQEIERLEKLLSLSQQQRKKLSIAAKGACQSIARRRNQLREKHGGDVPTLLQKQENLGVLMEGPLFQLTNSAIWQKSIGNTLDAQQLEKHSADQSIRFNRSQDAAAFTIVLGYEDSSMPFSMKEYQDFSQLIEKYLTQDPAGDSPSSATSIYFEAFAAVLKIEDEELQSCLSEESYGRVHSILEQARNRAEQFSDAGDDSDDD